MYNGALLSFSNIYQRNRISAEDSSKLYIYGKRKRSARGDINKVIAGILSD